MAALSGCPGEQNGEAIPTTWNRIRPEISEWRFLLDQNIDPKVATYLDREDLFAVHVRDALGQGADDEDDVLPHAREHDLVIATSDVKDFGALPTIRWLHPADYALCIQHGR